MKEKMKRFLLLLSAAVLSIAAAVPAFADEIYEPPVPEHSYNIFSYLLLIAYVVVGMMIVSGIVLIIVLSIRRKKRRQQGEQ